MKDLDWRTMNTTKQINLDINKKLSGLALEKNGIVIIDTKVWMRPKTACQMLKKKGIDVSYSLMNYWKNNGKVKSIVIESLDDLTLVNVETLPEEVRQPKKI